jgi:hypothetical protein
MSSIETMHTEHLNWFQQLDFYQDEVRFFQNRLLQLVLRRIKTLNMETVAGFRKQFMEMLMLLDDYRHVIAAHEASLSAALQKGEVEVHDHTEMNAKMEALAQAFGTLRSEFQQLQAAHP